MNTLWLKSWRDLNQRRIRSVLVVFAIFLSTTTLGVVLLTKQTLEYSLKEDFLASNPADIRFEVEKFPNADFFNDIAPQQIQYRSVATGIIKVGEDYENLWLFVIPNLADMKVDRLFLDQGEWSNENRSVAIERQARAFIGADIGDSITISVNDVNHTLHITAEVYDAALPQASWENIAYLYITEAQAQALGIMPKKREVGMTLQLQPPSEDIAAVVDTLIARLKAKGIELLSLKTNPEKEHPHSNVTKGMFLLQLAFAILTLLFSTVLVFNLTTAILTKERLQIGILKSHGANFYDIVFTYLRSNVVLAIGAFILSLPAVFMLSKAYAEPLAAMLNISVQSPPFSVSTWALLFFLAVCLPVIAIFTPCLRAAKTPIQASLRARDISSENIQFSRLSNFGLSPSILLAMRNALRNTKRSLLTVSLLSLAAMLFVTSFNVSRSMSLNVKEDANAKRWDLDIRFDIPADRVKLKNWLNSTSELSGSFYRQEYAKRTAEQRGETVQLNRIPLSNHLIRPQVYAGHWLSGSEDELVLDQKAHRALGRPVIGKPLNLYIDGEIHSFKLVGLSRSIGTSGGYTALKKTDLKNALMISSHNRQEAQIKEFEKNLIQYTKKNDISIDSINNRHHETEVITSHFVIVFALLFILSLLGMSIAASGVALATSINISERLKELSTMRVIGASSRQINALISSETIILSTIACAVCVVISIPFSSLVLNALGELLIGVGLVMYLDIRAYVALFPVVLCVALLPALTMTLVHSRKALGPTLRTE